MENDRIYVSQRERPVSGCRNPGFQAASWTCVSCILCPRARSTAGGLLVSKALARSLTRPCFYQQVHGSTWARTYLRRDNLDPKPLVTMTGSSGPHVGGWTACSDSISIWPLSPYAASCPSPAPAGSWENSAVPSSGNADAQARESGRASSSPSPAASLLPLPTHERRAFQSPVKPGNSASTALLIEDDSDDDDDRVDEAREVRSPREGGLGRRRRPCLRKGESWVEPWISNGRGSLPSRAELLSLGHVHRVECMGFPCKHHTRVKHEGVVFACCRDRGGPHSATLSSRTPCSSWSTCDPAVMLASRVPCVLFPLTLTPA